MEENKTIKIHWVDSSLHCDNCGYSTTTDLTISREGSEDIVDLSGGCFGNIYDNPASAVEAVLKLLGYTVELKQEYVPSEDTTEYSDEIETEEEIVDYED